MTAFILGAATGLAYLALSLITAYLVVAILKGANDDR